MHGFLAPVELQGPIYTELQSLLAVKVVKLEILLEVALDACPILVNLHSH